MTYIIQDYLTTFKSQWKQLSKKSKIRKALNIKKLIKDTKAECPDVVYLEELLSKWDQRTLTQVQGNKWVDTVFLPFAIMMFNRTFNYIGRKLSLPENYEITYC